MKTATESDGKAGISAAVRAASEGDAEGIKRLIDKFKFDENGNGKLIPLGISDISLLIGDNSFWVVEANGAIVACGSVAKYEGIVELRSLAVDYGHHGKGLATAIIGRCIEEARKRGHRAMYTLTQPHNFHLFERAGFLKTATPPEKLSKDCKNCPNYNSCNETAFMIML